MTNSLRSLSSRPELVVDQQGQPGSDPKTASIPGRPGPFGRNRLVSALPLRDGPVTIVKPYILTDAAGGTLADPHGLVIGTPGVKIDRLVSAAKAADTRRL